MCGKRPNANSVRSVYSTLCRCPSMINHPLYIRQQQQLDSQYGVSQVIHRLPCKHTREIELIHQCAPRNVTAEGKGLRSWNRKRSSGRVEIASGQLPPSGHVTDNALFTCQCDVFE